VQARLRKASWMSSRISQRMRSLGGGDIADQQCRGPDQRSVVGLVQRRHRLISGPAPHARRAGARGGRPGQGTGHEPGIPGRNRPGWSKPRNPELLLWDQPVVQPPRRSAKWQQRRERHQRPGAQVAPVGRDGLDIPVAGVLVDMTVLAWAGGYG